MSCASSNSDNVDDHDKPRRVSTEKLAKLWYVYWKCGACGHDWLQVTGKDPRKS
jgi:hypothetical protein